MTDPMTPEELKACRERAEAATPGPWEMSRRDDVMGGFDYFVEAGPLCVAVAAEDARPTRGMGAKRDAAFIAHARTDIPRLLATIAARDAELAALRAPAPPRPLVLPARPSRPRPRAQRPTPAPASSARRRSGSRATRATCSRTPSSSAPPSISSSRARPTSTSKCTPTTRATCPR